MGRPPGAVAAKIPPPAWLSLAVAAACLVALAPCPYGYYQLLGIVVTGYAVWIALFLIVQQRPVWPWPFALVGVLYNPILKIHMSRDVHNIENIFTALLIVAAMTWARPSAASE